MAIDTTQIINVNNQIKFFDLANPKSLPTLSRNTKELLKKIDPNLPETMEPSPLLKRKITTLEETKAALKLKEDHPVKYNAIAFAATLTVVTLAALLITGFIIGITLGALVTFVVSLSLIASLLLLVQVGFMTSDTAIFVSPVDEERATLDTFKKLGIEYRGSPTLAKPTTAMNNYERFKNGGWQVVESDGELIYYHDTPPSAVMNDSLTLAFTRKAFLRKEIKSQEKFINDLIQTRKAKNKEVFDAARNYYAGASAAHLLEQVKVNLCYLQEIQASLNTLGLAYPMHDLIKADQELSTIIDYYRNFCTLTEIPEQRLG